MEKKMVMTMSDSNITFDINSFSRDKISLLKFLKSLKYKGLFKRTKDLDIFFSQQPSLAYKYIRNIIIEKEWRPDPSGYVYLNVDKNRFEPEQEKVFLKNIKFGIAYLEATQQKKFRDEKINKKFEKKLYKDAGASFDYATRVLQQRISEDKEHIFLDNYYVMYHYSMIVIKGKFPDKIHNQIHLRSFEKNVWRFDCLQAYLKQDSSLLDKNYSYYK